MADGSKVERLVAVSGRTAQFMVYGIYFQVRKASIEVVK